MLNFFWPTRRAEQSNFMVRLGRLLHWTCVVLAVVTLVFMAFAIHYFMTDRYYAGTTAWTQVPIAYTVIVLLLLMLGRALRYLFAAE